MKTLPFRFLAGGTLLLALTLPASAARPNGGAGTRDLRPNNRVNPGHQRTGAEKDARSQDRDVKRTDSQEKRRAELLKRFDANHDGVLDDTEKATMEAALKKRAETRDRK